MSNPATEEVPERHYEVSLLLHPYATSATEAYLMAVDTIIRYGMDSLHVLVTDTETNEQFLMTEDGLVSGEALQEALERLEEQLAAATQQPDGTADSD